MSIEKAIGLGVTANEFSKQITGSSESSAGRTIVATSTGATMGLVAGGAVTIGATAAGIVAAPVAIPLAACTALVAGIASWFD